MRYEKLTEAVIKAAIEVHRILGPGLLESSYEQCIAYELKKGGINFKLQHGLPVEYKEMKLDCGYRIDMFVEEKLIVELKSLNSILPIHEAQILTYMKLAKVKVGLLINFNLLRLKEGLRRFVL